MDLLSSTVRSHSADAQEWEDQEDVEWSLGVESEGSLHVWVGWCFPYS